MKNNTRVSGRTQRETTPHASRPPQLYSDLPAAPVTSCNRGPDAVAESVKERERERESERKGRPISRKKVRKTCYVSGFTLRKYTAVSAHSGLAAVSSGSAASVTSPGLALLFRATRVRSMPQNKKKNGGNPGKTKAMKRADSKPKGCIKSLYVRSEALRADGQVPAPGSSLL